MTKVEAIEALIREGRDEGRATTQKARRAVKACRTLGLDDAEVLAIMKSLDYAHYETGEPYNEKIERVWP